jgi:GT2 family glycosyltransferase
MKRRSWTGGGLGDLSVHNDTGVGIVVIGRNEGPRLVRCLASLPDGVPCVYVDSESRDDSVAAARKAGAEVVTLTTPPKHSAARARNAGISRLRSLYPSLDYVMLVDGDCEVAADWIIVAHQAMIADPALGLVFGRRRERFPDRSIYNALCDDEWNQPVGEALSCGGDVFCRLAALVEIGGYRETMIAGEDPDMASRMRDAGWRLYRLDAEMTVHDAAILHFSQWWRRTRRAGHAFGQLAHLHPGPGMPNWRGQCRSIVAWGAILPLLVVCSAGLGAALNHRLWVLTIVLLALWTLQLLRLSLKRRDLIPCIALANAFFLMLGKIAQAGGLMAFHRERWTGRESKLIEYKGLG